MNYAKYIYHTTNKSKKADINIVYYTKLKGMKKVNNPYLITCIQIVVLLFTLQRTLIQTYVKNKSTKLCVDNSHIIIFIITFFAGYLFTSKVLVITPKLKL